MCTSRFLTSKHRDYDGPLDLCRSAQDSRFRLSQIYRLKKTACGTPPSAALPHPVTLLRCRWCRDQKYRAIQMLVPTLQPLSSAAATLLQLLLRLKASLQKVQLSPLLRFFWGGGGPLGFPPFSTLRIGAHLLYTHAKVKRVEITLLCGMVSFSVSCASMWI